jgi:hypothetical protein
MIESRNLYNRVLPISFEEITTATSYALGNIVVRNLA